MLTLLLAAVLAAPPEPTEWRIILAEDEATLALRMTTDLPTAARPGTADLLISAYNSNGEMQQRWIRMTVSCQGSADPSGHISLVHFETAFADTDPAYVFDADRQPLQTATFEGAGLTGGIAATICAGNLDAYPKIEGEWTYVLRRLEQGPVTP